MKNQKNSPIESLTNEQLEKISNYNTPFNDESINIIHNLFKQKRNKKNKILNPKIVIVASISLVLFLVGFTKFDEIKNMLNNFFGSKGDTIIVLGEKSDEVSLINGIELKSLYSIKDDTESYFFFTLEDKEGNRIDADTNIQESFEISNGHGDIDLVNFEEDKNKATFVLRFFEEPSSLTTKNIFSIDNIYSNPKNIEKEIKDINIYEMVKDDLATFSPDEEYISYNDQASPYMISSSSSSNSSDGKIYDKIAPRRLSIPFDEFKSHFISNIGYHDGNLHILLENKDISSYQTRYLFLQLKNKKTGELIEILQDTTYNNQFTEYIIPVSYKEDLKNYNLYIDAMKYDTVIDGSWEVSFPKAKSIEPIILAENIVFSTNVGEFNIDKIEATPLSIAIYIKDNIYATFKNFIDSVFQEQESSSITNDDGSIIIQNGMRLNNDGKGNIVITLRGTDIFEPKKIKEIKLNNEIIHIK